MSLLSLGEEQTVCTCISLHVAVSMQTHRETNKTGQLLWWSLTVRRDISEATFAWLELKCEKRM